jgi:poly-gamma-glutamate synthesis protein (capsule biosynthesis protein)
MGIEETVLRLALVGDIALGNHPKTPGFGFYSKYAKGVPPSLAQRVLPSGIFPDVVFGNMEFALANDMEHPGTNATCLGSDAYIPFLRQSGFTVLNVANNHAWQHGEGLFWKTVNSLQRVGIKVVGVPDDFDPSGFLRIKGMTVAILGCSARPRQGFTVSPGYNEFEEGSFLQAIRDARRHSDLVCASIHWGEEFLPIPNPREKEIARAMIEAGATLVVGHHPHVLREVETYRHGVIAYSLGNFIGDMVWNPLTRETGCLIVEARDSRIVSKAFLPAVIGRDYLPRYLDESASLEFLKDQKARNDHLNADLATSAYEILAQRALKHHQWLTLGFLLKNLFRYRLSTLGKIVSHALKVRLQKSQQVKS